MTSRQTLDQRRAAHAWGVVTEWKRIKEQKKDENRVKDLVGHAKKLPMRIRAAGLGHALAFVHAKDQPDLLIKLAEWVLFKRKSPDAKMGDIKASTLIDAIVGGNSDFLRSATHETMEYLQWLNRFADGEGLKSSE